MKYLGLVWAGLRRKKLRTILTILALWAAFTLLGLLQAVNSLFSGAADFLPIELQSFFAPSATLGALRMTSVQGTLCSTANQGIGIKNPFQERGRAKKPPCGFIQG